MTQANQADFFGGGAANGLYGQPQAPSDPDDQPNPANPGGISNNELMRRQRAISDPAYAATRAMEQTTAPKDAFGNSYSTLSAGTPTGQTQYDSNGNAYQVVADSPAQRDAYNSAINTVASGPSRNPVLTPGAGNGTPGTGNAPGAQQAMSSATSNANAIEDKSAADTQTISNLWGSIGLDTSQSDQSRQQQADAFGMNKQLYDTLMAYDPAQEAKRASNAAMDNQLAIARSAVGGAGARQEAMFNALGQAPAIQSAAMGQARQEQATRTGEALQAASQAGSIATGTRSQDVTTAMNQVQTGVQVAQGIADALGTDLKIEVTEAQMLAQVQSAVMNSGIQWAQLSEQERENKFRDLLSSQGLAQQESQFEKSRNLSPKDILGAITSVGGEAVSGGFKIAAAGAGA